MHIIGVCRHRFLNSEDVTCAYPIVVVFSLQDLIAMSSLQWSPEYPLVRAEGLAAVALKLYARTCPTKLESVEDIFELNVSVCSIAAVLCRLRLFCS